MRKIANSVIEFTYSIYIGIFCYIFLLSEAEYDLNNFQNISIKVIKLPLVLKANNKHV